MQYLNYLILQTTVKPIHVLRNAVKLEVVSDFPEKSATIPAVVIMSSVSLP